jgi:nitrogen fixation/metabolism regulation signal transduction histidine kinase
MTHLQEKAKDIVHSVEHPVEAAKELEREAEEGKSARTPLIALTGVTLVVFGLLAIMLAIVMTLYFVYGGH